MQNDHVQSMFKHQLHTTLSISKQKLYDRSVRKKNINKSIYLYIIKYESTVDVHSTYIY